MILPVIFIIPGSVWVISCNESPQPVHGRHDIGMMDDSIINYNRQMVENEALDIEDFISRYHWQMVKTKTGLRYMVYKKGQGALAAKGDEVEIRFSTMLLNGDVVERADTGKPFRFRIGTGSVTNGLEEGVLLMKPGDQSRLIVPSHLAFGLLGDLNKIPNRAVLVYDVELCQIYSSNK